MEKDKDGQDALILACRLHGKPGGEGGKHVDLVRQELHDS